MSREFRNRDGVHVCASAEPIREEDNVGVSPRCSREGGEVVDAHRDEDGSTHRLSGRLARLAL